LARANGIELAWQSFGDEHAPPVLLIMGLGMQMIGWDEAFCAQLAAGGFRVIRFDNRDVGKSSWLDDRADPNVLEVWDRLRRRKPVEPAYRLADLADDAVALLDALALPRAHVIGLSMGGMIAQELAIRHSDRVITLTSIMANTGESDIQGPSYETLTELIRPIPADKEGFISRSVAVAHLLRGSASATSSPSVRMVDDARVRRLAARSFERGFHPAGLRRQLVAIWTSPGRRAALTQLRIPTLIIHGDADPLVPLDGGRDTARTIPAARLLVLQGVGHDLPPTTWPTVLEAFFRLSHQDLSQ
jgi:pimeloyl-ACP methyl ester carboxylesterase